MTSDNRMITVYGKVPGNPATREESFDSCAVFSDFDAGTLSGKELCGARIRIDAKRKASARVSVAYDNREFTLADSCRTISDYYVSTVFFYRIHIPKHKLIKLKISGKGEYTVNSITLEYRNEGSYD